MTRRLLTVALVGAECTGKTTLALALADHFGVPWVSEYARAYLEPRGGAYEPEDLVHIARGQWRREQAALRASSGLVIVDTDALVIQIWSEVKYGTAPQVVVGQMRAAQLAAAAGERYYVVPYPDIPWEFDPLRESADSRTALHARYVAELKRQVLPFIEVHGPHTQRLTQALDGIAGLTVR